MDLDGAEEKRAESGDVEGLPRVQVDPEVSGKWWVSPPREDTQKEEQVGGELAEVCGPFTSDVLSFRCQLEMPSRRSIWVWSSGERDLSRKRGAAARDGESKPEEPASVTGPAYLHLFSLIFFVPFTHFSFCPIFFF